MPAAAEAAAADEDLDAVVLVSASMPPFPPTKIIEDNYIAVVGKLRTTIKKEAYLVKDIVYADRSPSYSRAVEKRDEGRYTVAALNFANALDEMKEQKWAAEYCNYGIANAFYANHTFSGYQGKARSYAPAADYFVKRARKPTRSRASCSTS